MERSKVYELIDGERDYQDQRWNPETTTSGGKHSLEEWVMYIETYLGEAKRVLTRAPRQEADPVARSIMRKVAAMSVACLEQHGAESREIEQMGL